MKINRSTKIALNTKWIMLTHVAILVMFVLQIFNVRSVQASTQSQEITTTPTAEASLTPQPTATAQPAATPLPPVYEWRDIPEDSSRLASDRKLSLLAGQFIFHGMVDASSCADGGLLESGAATTCGESVAHNAVIVWQNQFDADIYAAALANDIPPFILKNIFVKESQFWPETYQNPVYGGEFGLGHLTLMGADMLLSWNLPYYKEVCTQNFSEETCAEDYVFQSTSVKNNLKGVVLSSVDADCSTCFGGVDLEKARNSVYVTAEMLVANRNHVRWLVSGSSASSNLSHSNLWKYTLTSYNAGPGCLTNAYYTARRHGNPLYWKDVSQGLNDLCKGAVGYVASIEVVDTADPAILTLAALDTSPAARLVLGPLTTPTPIFTSTVEAPSMTMTPQVTETPSAETPTATDTLLPESPTPDGSLIPTATETPSVTLAPSETPVPTFTATETPIAQPTAFVPAADVPTGEIVVKFGGLVPEFIAESAVGSAGGEVVGQVDALGLTVISAPEDQIPQVLASLQDSILVEYAEPNYAVQAFYTPTDPEYVSQTYLADMQIPEAWDVTKGEGVVVAVIDTGVDTAHPDLTANMLVNSGEDGLDTNGNDRRTNLIDDDNDGYVDNWMGWNFVDGNNDARDGHGHGTHLAGIIAAQMDNSLGISGIAPNARILPIKALDNTGFGSYSQVAQAIIYAVDHGAQVINLGFGGTANSELLVAATDYAYANGVIVVAAGGNTGAQTLIYPAANPNVIGVSALDDKLTVANFSSYTNAIQVSAPGVGIYSTTPGGKYAAMSGTSMSTAQISGVMALLLTQSKFNSPDTARDALFGSAVDLGDAGLDIHYGYGLVHAFDALSYVPGAVFATPTASPTAEVITIPTNVPAGDGVTIMADQPPTVNIISPADNSVLSQNSTITFIGSATVPVNADISHLLIWRDGASIICSNCASFGLNNLTVGSHIISASATDDLGRTTTTTITVTVSDRSDPHGAFTATTDKCAACHRAHTAQSPALIASPLSGNAYCLSCHSESDKIAVSTHSNKDWAGPSIEKTFPLPAASFELLCTQCHNPHGNKNNIFSIRDNVRVNASGSITTGPVTFTAVTGVNSFDDGVSATASRICVTCHVNTNNPGYPMNNHAGGANHSGGVDYSQTDCVTCHLHSADGFSSTSDGFMASCRACHSKPQDNGDNVPVGGRRQIVGATGGDFTRNSHHVSGSDSITDADCQLCHEMSRHTLGSVRLYDVDTITNPVPVVYNIEDGLNDADDYENACKSCHDANGRSGDITPLSDNVLVPSIAGQWASARHNGVFTTFLGSCRDCHDSGHGSNKQKLLAPWNSILPQAGPDVMRQEERFCYQCHSAAGPGLPVEAAFSTWTNTATRVFEHDVSVDNGLEHNKEIFGSSFADRHIECGDCHESHTAQYPTPITVTAPNIKFPQQGSNGVQPVFAGPGAPTTFNFMDQAAFEYQVCMKCHSSFTTLPTYLPDGWGCAAPCAARTFVPNGLRKITSGSALQVLDSRDMAEEFNPANGSFHPVMAAGTNPSAPAGGFTAGWGPTSRTYCTDCHTNDIPATGNTGYGPHGSPLLHILDGSTTTGAGTNYSTTGLTGAAEPLVSNTELCFKCHNYADYVTSATATNTRFRDGNNNLHSEHMGGGFTNTTCYTCHDTHGSEQLHLINFDAAVAVPQGGRNSQSAWVSTGNANPTTTGTCYVACHGQTHGAGDSYSP